MKQTQEQLREAENKKYTVPALPALSHPIEGIVQRVDGHGGEVFFRATNKVLVAGKEWPAGTVFSLRHHRGTCLLDRYDTNENDRRLWCKLTGNSYKDLNAIRKQREADRAQRVLESDVKDFLEKAKKLGYKVTKL